MRTIIRKVHNKDSPYLTVSKETVRDHSISFEARGFLMFLLAKPDDWQTRPEQLAEECKLHRTTIFRLLRKLIQGGYVKREEIRRRRDDGRYECGCLYTVFEDKKDGELYNCPF
jgi:DNA-binding MarR family transcriptional regulator